MLIRIDAYQVSFQSESGSDCGSTNTTESIELPGRVRDFFAHVTAKVYPGAGQKTQPWKNVWKGPQKPSEDGKLIVTCPKRCDFGINYINYYCNVECLS